MTLKQLQDVVPATVGKNPILAGTGYRIKASKGDDYVVTGFNSATGDVTVLLKFDEVELGTLLFLDNAITNDTEIQVTDIDTGDTETGPAKGFIDSGCIVKAYKPPVIFVRD